MSVTFSDANMGASSKLLRRLESDGTTLTVTAGTGSRFATPTGTFSWATLRYAGLMERVMVTQVVGDTLTVVRGAQNTTAQTFAAGSCIDVEWTGAAIKALVSSLTGGAGGYTGTLATPFVGIYEDGRLISATDGSSCS